ncbi:26766_t:CDS:1, partial [Dentiscutata erythropus]
DKPTEIVAQIRKADEILESNMSIPHFDTRIESYVSKRFDTLSAMEIGNHYFMIL